MRIAALIVISQRGSTGHFFYSFAASRVSKTIMQMEGHKTGLDASTKQSRSRADIVRAMSGELSKIGFVQAFWEGGAVAWGRVDEYSDIDAYLLVDEGKVQETFYIVEKILASLSPIRQKYVVKQNWPGLSQAFYRLENASDFLVLDLGILTNASPEKFLEPAIHGRSVFYFNKKEIDQTPFVNMEAFESKARENHQAMMEKFSMFSNFVEKELKRGNTLEALEYYRTLVIPSLVQALRQKYSPMHYDFRMRYIHYDLPTDVVERLERLSFVSGKKDLETKYPEAIKWFEMISDSTTTTQKKGLRTNEIWCENSLLEPGQEERSRGSGYPK